MKKSLIVTFLVLGLSLSMGLGYDQVLNFKAVDKNGVPVFLCNGEESHFTSVLIDEVNKGK